MKPQEKQVIYYSKPTDDFAGTNIKTQRVDETFRYIRDGRLWNAAAFGLYYIVALPLVWLFSKAVFGTKFVNRKALRHIRGGVFLYGNHTHWSDAFLPHIAAAPKRTYLIAGPDAVSIRGLRNVVQMLGCIPVPTGARGLRQFVGAVEKRGKDGCCVAVYPEAHIWPYYAGIRPFSPTSFTYPAELGLPVVAMVTTYHKRRGLTRFIKTPARTVTLSEPFYAKPGVPVREAQNELCRNVMDFMKDHVKSSNKYEYIRYIQR